MIRGFDTSSTGLIRKKCKKSDLVKRDFQKHQIIQTLTMQSL